jgi:hypothetical protein
MGLDVALIRFTVLSLMLGFVAFCVIEGGHIWWRRNRRVAAESGSTSSWAVWVSSLVVLLGVVILAIAVPLREIMPIDGDLVSNGAFAVRVPDDAELTYLTDATTIHAGDMLAKFHCPQWDTDIHTFTDRISGYKIQRDSLTYQPLLLDPELTRRLQTATTDRRQLEATLQTVLPAHANLTRELLHTSLERQEAIAKLDGDINSALRDLRESEVQYVHSKRQVNRYSILAKSKLPMLSAQEMETHQKDAKVNGLEVNKYKQHVEDLKRQKKSLVDAIASMETMAQDQGRIFEETITKFRADYNGLLKTESECQSRLSVDEVRARSLRKLEIAQLDAKLQETKSMLEGIHNKAVVVAPRSGQVAYRSSSPQAAAQKTCVLVVTPPEGFLLKVKLTPSQWSAIEHDSSQLEVMDQGTGYRFPAKVSGARNYGEYRQVELACQPFPEIVQHLADGEKMQARLLWRPPLRTTLPFAIGVVVLLLGVVGRILTGWTNLFDSGGVAVTESCSPLIAGPPSAEVLAAPIPSQLAAKPAPTTVEGQIELELGILGRQLLNLGVRLRDGIQKQAVDAELLAAVEWAVDRHQCRAIRVLNVGLGDIELLRPTLAQLLATGGERVLRLERILRVLQPEVTESLLSSAPLARA